jgi:hypothetical protein
MATKSIPSLAETVTESGLVYSGKCILRGFTLGTDGVNDPAIVIYDGTSASGTEVVPTATYDASLLGLNGATGLHHYCANGIYVGITCAGSVKVTVYYVPFHYAETLNWPADGKL